MSEVINPDENLRAQALLSHGPRRNGVLRRKVDRTRLYDLRLELSAHLAKGGAEPNWNDYPLATEDYWAWKLYIQGMDK